MAPLSVACGRFYFNYDKQVLNFFQRHHELLRLALGILDYDDIFRAMHRSRRVLHARNIRARSFAKEGLDRSIQLFMNIVWLTNCQGPKAP